MTDEMFSCPNCRSELDPGVVICPTCRFDTTLSRSDSDVIGSEPTLTPSEAGPPRERRDCGPGGHCLLQIGEVIGHERFEIVSFLGKGAMGEVYKARHVFANRTVAIKAIYDDAFGNSKARERFLNEARTLASLKHENIVEFVDVFVDKDRFFLAMEYVEGKTLSTKIGEYAVSNLLMPMSEVVSCIRGVLQGLACAHSQEHIIVHRDIKPSNIMITDNGDRVVVMDFGVAKMINKESIDNINNAKGTVAGTYEYMSPEQCQGLKAGPASDIYSVGIMAYELITGEVPFPCSIYPGIAGISDAHRYKAPVGIREITDDCPGWLAELVHRSLAKMPMGRFTDARQMLVELEAGASSWNEGSAKQPRPLIARKPEPDVTVRTNEIGPQILEPLPSPTEAEVLRPAPSGTRPKRWVLAAVAAFAILLAVIVLIANYSDIVETGEQEDGQTEVNDVDRLKAEASRLAQEAEDKLTEANMEAARARAEAEAKSEEARLREKELAELRSKADELAEQAKDAQEARVAAQRKYRGKLVKDEAEKAARLEKERIRTELDWVIINGGSFQMGSLSGDTDEQPVHLVTIPTFEMSRSEVTVGQYKKCVDANACSRPIGKDKDCTWNIPGRQDYPVNCVDWNQANDYATWANARLPTEAEWEYAARSRGKELRYPWGDSLPDSTFGAALSDKDKGGEYPAKVCSRTKGNTEQGLCDMAGNLWEWCKDWYGEKYYKKSPAKNPKGEESGSERVNRGGGLETSPDDFRTTDRWASDPDTRSELIGFRVARDSK